MIESVDVGKTYFSKSGCRFIVTGIARHGQDCSHQMVVYVNLDDTVDAKVGKLWVISESIFLNRMSEERNE